MYGSLIVTHVSQKQEMLVMEELPSVSQTFKISRKLIVLFLWKIDVSFIIIRGVHKTALETVGLINQWLLT